MIKRILDKIKWTRAKNAKITQFRNEFLRFKNSYKGTMRLDFTEAIPYLDDKTADTGFDAHYIYHPAWAARLIKKNAPALHTDISSTLHFCSLLSAFIPVAFYDYRPARLQLGNLTTVKCDLTQLDFTSGSIESLSCMHTLEHIGLGRYGDPIDPLGDVKAINELKRVVKPNGSLFVVVPVGEPKIVFNAHRIYDPVEFVKLFEGFRLADFSLVKDNNDFIEGIDPVQAKEEKYGCGCYWFIKSGAW